MVDKLKGRCVIKTFFLVFFVVMVLFPSLTSAGENGFIDDVAVINSDKDLLAYWVVRDAFSEDMSQGIKNGISVTFTFIVEMTQKKGGASDLEILSRSFDHTLSYDSLKQIYTVQLSENNERIVSVADFDAAKSLMTEIHDFRLVDLADMEEGATYHFRVKAKLAKKKLPLNFQYIIPFRQLWKFETDWHGLTFTYGHRQKLLE